MFYCISGLYGINHILPAIFMDKRQYHLFN